MWRETTRARAAAKARCGRAGVAAAGAAAREGCCSTAASALTNRQASRASINATPTFTAASRNG